MGWSRLRCCRVTTAIRLELTWSKVRINFSFARLQYIPQTRNFFQRINIFASLSVSMFNFLSFPNLFFLLVDKALFMLHVPRQFYINLFLGCCNLEQAKKNQNSSNFFRVHGFFLTQSFVFFSHRTPREMCDVTGYTIISDNGFTS